MYMQIVVKLVLEEKLTGAPENSLTGGAKFKTKASFFLDRKNCNYGLETNGLKWKVKCSKHS